MTTQDRIDAMSEFCARHDWGFEHWISNQREPGDGVAVTIRGLTLKSESQDSLEVAVARMELALTALARAAGDEYLHSPHDLMGRLG